MAEITFVEVDPVMPHGDDCGCWGCKYDRAEEKRRQLVSQCPGHEWEMELGHPEDYPDDAPGVALGCAHCPANADDVYPDGTDMIFTELDNGVRVDGGRHDSPVPLVVPVDVGVETSKLWTDYGWEYDAVLIVEQRGPIRFVPDPPGGSRVGAGGSG